jgi:hypothetical protein
MNIERLTSVITGGAGLTLVVTGDPITTPDKEGAHADH